MRRAWRTLFDSGAGFLLASVFSFLDALHRDDSAWLSYLLTATWGFTAIASHLEYRRKRRGEHRPAADPDPPPR